MTERRGVWLLACSLLFACGAEDQLRPVTAEAPSPSPPGARSVPFVLPQYELTWLPTGFEPSAMDAAGRIGGSIKTGSSYVAAIYDASAGTLDTRVVSVFFRESWIVAMNARGDVVGGAAGDPRYGGPTGMFPFVRYADGTAAFLFAEHGMPVTSGEALAIDAAGVAYGYAGLLRTGSSSLFGYARADEMSLFGDERDFVIGVSPSGVLVGCRYSPDNHPRPVVFRGGAAVFVAPDVPAFSGCLSAVSDAGVAVGGFHTAREIGAYIWDGTSAKVLPFEVAHSINARGTVVGAKVIGSVVVPGNDTAFVTHAALWLGGAEALDLSELMHMDRSTALAEAIAINDAGAIVGIGGKGGFLLTPKR